MRAVALLLIIGACGTSGGDDDGGTVVPAGVYTGTGTFTGSQVVNGAKQVFSTAPTITTIVTTSGAYLVLSAKLAVISQLDLGTGAANGMLTAANNTEFGIYPDFDSNNFALLPANQNGAFAASFTTGKTLDATITYSGTSGDVLATKTTFVAGSAAAPAALPATLSGTFYSTSNSGQRINTTAMSTLTITGTSFTGSVTCPLKSTMPPPQPTLCTATGTLTPRTDIAAYDVSLMFADGNSEKFPTGWTGVTATGLAYFDGTKLVLGAASGANAYAFSN
ncbi:MAG: hypothetical protein ABJE66_04185 [Deltaproteobacteria bacterium]